MPTYEFACGECAWRGEQRYSMSEVPSATACPECGGVARRLVSAPRVGRGDSAALRLQDSTRASADAPQVVTSVPGRSRRATPVTRNPLHAKLPRD